MIRGVSAAEIKIDEICVLNHAITAFIGRWHDLRSFAHIMLTRKSLMLKAEMEPSVTAAVASRYIWTS